ncbi:MAG TPA: hydrogenase 4 subunit B, partial [Paraburkholderia sp.]|nr:hydrogenase 4 subunit B [Paraburkholderia sp.]
MEHALVIPLVVHYVLLVIAGWLVVGVAGLANLRRTRVVAHGLFPAGAVFGLLLCGLGLTGVFAGPQQVVLPLGLP